MKTCNVKASVMLKCGSAQKSQYDNILGISTFHLFAGERLSLFPRVVGAAGGEPSPEVAADVRPARLLLLRHGAVQRARHRGRVESRLYTNHESINTTNIANAVITEGGLKAVMQQHIMKFKI